MKTTSIDTGSDYEGYYLNQVWLGSNNSVDYEKCYHSQVGGGFYRGIPVQRGYGLGNLLGSIFRRAVPLLKKGAIFLGKKVLKTGSKVAADVASGVPIKSSLKDYGTTIGKETLSELKDMVKQRLSGSGLKRKRRKIEWISSVVAKKRRRRALKHADIISK